MINMPIRPLSAAVVRTAPTGQTVTARAEAAAPKTDVIDMSKPPTPEQAERMRNAGILGYGSVSASKQVATETRGDGFTMTHFISNYQHTFFDVVNEATYQNISTSAGVFTSGGSFAYASFASQLVQNWKDGSSLKAELQQAAYSFRMSGIPSWYIPAHKNEDGTFSLAQFGPCPTATVSGYRSSLTITQSGGGQTQVSRYETLIRHAVTTSPDQEHPEGAVDYKNENFDRIITDELLDRIDKCAQTLYRFDTQA
ncbi:hypothetical protein [Pseudoflavonifractor sp. 60]|uniref:hypothetical protein n=1 Tax=Pseudoflavonifractor sp. 60 TaxID=2304576 RepID=UPI0013685AE7|nr:hypothetical protein [Pseudoflavonifractor sp. 60]